MFLAICPGVGLLVLLLKLLLIWSMKMQVSRFVLFCWSKGNIEILSPTVSIPLHICYLILSDDLTRRLADLRNPDVVAPAVVHPSLTQVFFQINSLT